MPTYVYECPKCHRQVELVRSIKEDSTEPLCCEEDCGGLEMFKVIQPAAFHLKGKGWAKDGYSK